MKKIFFAFGTLLFAQQAPPTSRILDFPTAPNIHEIQIGASEKCDLFFHSPDPAHTQLACYGADGTIVKNEIIIPGLPGSSDSWTFPDGTISWVLTNTTFALSARATGDTTESKENGTF